MIKRENIKGKYYLVARERGKIRSKIRWNNKVSLDKYRDRYEKQGSFQKNKMSKRITPESKLYQVITYGEKKGNTWRVEKPKGSYQYLVVAEDKEKNKIEGTSRLYPKGYPKSEAKSEAYENLYRRISYDKDESDKEKYTIIHEGTITYAKR